ncbi:MAG TPA: hypothetical protein VM925_13925 [Labilithrix sp.]|nr:hypothetical protein [Labilithrix sp.]
MSFSRFVVACVFVTTFASLAGCSAESNGKEEQDVATTESQLKLSGTRYLGRIANGETRTVAYSSPPGFRSYGFDAKGGDEITVDVKSHNGDPIGWITDASYNVLAVNDDASTSTLESKVKYKVPAAQPARSYRIVFRDYDKLDAEFDVKLSIRSATTTTTCEYGGQRYRPGDQFASTDGCNTCTCGESGSVACTKMACACNPLKEPHRSYTGTPQQCMVIRYTCPTGQVPFSNACGCGCEPR